MTHSRRFIFAKRLSSLISLSIKDGYSIQTNTRRTFSMLFGVDVVFIGDFLSEKGLSRPPGSKTSKQCNLKPIYC